MDKSYKYFIGVVQAGNISKAVKKMRISQPALSASLKTLESHLKTELLVRSKKGIALTSTGKIVYKNALKIRDTERNTIQNLQARSKKQLSIDVGAIDSIASHIVGQLDSSSSLTHITVDDSSSLINKVENGQLEAAYVTKPEKEVADLRYRYIATEKMIAVSVKRFNSEIPLLAYNADSNTHRLIIHELNKTGIKYSIRLHSTDPHLLLEAARLGKGVAVIPKSLYTSANDPKLVHVFKKLKVLRPIIKVSRKSRYTPDELISIEDKIKKSLG